MNINDRINMLEGLEPDIGSENEIELRTLKKVRSGEIETNFVIIADALWKLLDNIDTASDIAKGDDKLYRNLVRQEHHKRFFYASSDGFKLTWDGEIRQQEREQ